MLKNGFMLSLLSIFLFFPANAMYNGRGFGPSGNPDPITGFMIGAVAAVGAIAPLIIREELRSLKEEIPSLIKRLKEVVDIEERCLLEIELVQLTQRLDAAALAKLSFGRANQSFLLKDLLPQLHQINPSLCQTIFRQLSKHLPRRLPNWFPPLTDFLLGFRALDPEGFALLDANAILWWHAELFVKAYIDNPDLDASFQGTPFCRQAVGSFLVSLKNYYVVEDLCYQSGPENGVFHDVCLQWIEKYYDPRSGRGERLLESPNIQIANAARAHTERNSSP